MDINCPRCKSNRVVTSPVKHTFECPVPILPRISLIGKIEVMLPVRECGICDYKWTDEEAEILVSDAILQYRENIFDKREKPR